MADVLLDAKAVTKAFPGVRALDGVDFAIRAGEVVGLLGENGAGKSTLVKILAGVYRADAGEIWYQGRRAGFAGIQDAQAAGVTLIHQELSNCPNLTPLDNLFLGRELRRRCSTTARCAPGRASCSRGSASRSTSMSICAGCRPRSSR
jgi:ABC-type sugar transport system ATPase subunit